MYKNILKRIYVDKDYEYFKKKSNIKIVFDDDFYEKVKAYGVKDIIKEDIDENISQRWYFKFDTYIDGNFKVSYMTLLQISKVVPVFHIQHEFEVENKDINNMCPVLDGFGSEPYIKNQANLCEYVKHYLNAINYTEIDYSQLNEIVINLEDNKAHIINGEKFSVEDLIFNDMFDME